LIKLKCLLKQKRSNFFFHPLGLGKEKEILKPPLFSSLGAGEKKIREGNKKTKLELKQ